MVTCELRLVRGPAVAPPLGECLLERVVVLERQRRVLDLARAELRLEVQLRGGAGQHADRRAAHVLEVLVLAVRPHHHPLAVVERRGEERRTLGSVPAGRPRRVPDQDVDLTSLERGEALLGSQRRVLDALSVSEHARRDGTAEVDVEPLEVAARGDEPEPRNGIVDPASQGPPILDLLEKACLLVVAAVEATREREHPDERYCRVAYERPPGHPDSFRSGHDSRAPR
jgi:hypothetical protein